MREPGLSVTINEETQDVTIAFTPQRLQPQEYGVVLASVILHIANSFLESNPQSNQGAILEAMLDGIKFGLENSPGIMAPTSHH
jgi:hypothetical protein